LLAACQGILLIPLNSNIIHQLPTLNAEHPTPDSRLRTLQGVFLAVLAAFIWSGNFIISRGIHKDIPPVTLNFFRWLTASVVILPFVWKHFNNEKAIVFTRRKYLFWVALTGIALFNSFVYIAGHHATAINMALIGTTSSPVIATFLAAAFLKERIRPLGVAGLMLCIAGIIVLLSNGSLERLYRFRFSEGDWWILLGATFFAIYNTLVKRKPPGLSSMNFLFTCFFLGTLMLLPFSLWEMGNHPPLVWTAKLIGMISFLGIGASVISYWCWNLSIARLGAARTAMFGNLIPLFSAVEAVLLLDEHLTVIHVISGGLVIAGLVVANLNKANSS
jgi:drug/metabolite transporter (DMT)-like permease